MTTTPAFEAHGFTFQIASSDAEIVGAFDELLIDMRVDPLDSATTPTTASTSSRCHQPDGDDSGCGCDSTTSRSTSHSARGLGDLARADGAEPPCREHASRERLGRAARIHRHRSARRRRARRRLALRQDDAGSGARARRRWPTWPARRRSERLRPGGSRGGTVREAGRPQDARSRPARAERPTPPAPGGAASRATSDSCLRPSSEPDPHHRSARLPWRRSSFRGSRPHGGLGHRHHDSTLSAPSTP